MRGCALRICDEPTATVPFGRWQLDRIERANHVP
jgi:hypothetical protein